ncbi:hypothetical protein LCGC14_0810440 [marine sediment metagenome]|uniref:Uncharacterized protein n=1 Tax=marine sediment metagenome TaxID=412755 RepID=A0A0F9PM01_9ZZZZ
MIYWLEFIVHDYWLAFVVTSIVFAGIAGRMVYDLVLED